jgi:hypothetical protein
MVTKKNIKEIYYVYPVTYHMGLLNELNIGAGVGHQIKISNKFICFKSKTENLITSYNDYKFATEEQIKLFNLYNRLNKI